LLVQSRRFAEEDWAYSWREYFPVLHIGRRLVIQPTWREYEPDEDEIVLHLDPGLAFGTGQHPTTRLCLEALEDAVRQGVRVLDVGTGSGILAIAAAKLGADSALGLDIEPQAVQAARENAQLNDVADKVRAMEGSLNGVLATEPAGFDLVVANISALTICDLAAELVEALRDGGSLIASGFIVENEAAVASALTEAGLAIDRTSADGDWRAVFATKVRTTTL
jgi:ribosomal protein L11 methyltransferase